MTSQQQLDERISRWLEADAPSQLPGHVLHSTFERTRNSRQHGGWRALLGRPFMSRFALQVGAAAVVVLGAGLALSWWAGLPGPGGPSPVPSVEATPTSTPTFVVGPDDGKPLGWSRDGSRLLLQKDDGDLFILHANGSETQVTDQLTGFGDIPGSARPVGATISPDGLRVVFAGLTQAWQDGRSCHYGALFAVSADGGPAEVLWESRAAGDGGIVRYPTFSPDGARIAFADGYCDHNHSVWVMNADGSDAHQIVSIDEAGWVHGVAWSAGGDRIALLYRGFDQFRTYTFAPDGSGLSEGVDGSVYCWPGSRRRCEP